MSETSFGSLFAQHEALHRTLSRILADKAGPVELRAVAAELRKAHPSLDLPAPDVHGAIRDAAEAAGIPLKADRAELPPP